MKVKVVLQEVYVLKDGKIELCSTKEELFVLTKRVPKEYFIKRENISIDIQDVEDRLLEKMKSNEEYSFYVLNVYNVDINEDEELEEEYILDYYLEYNGYYISKDLLDYIDYKYKGIKNF
jgi:spore cortex formation protein SpoVR/YcgB (stage V sporulation)